MNNFLSKIFHVVKVLIFFGLLLFLTPNSASASGTWSYTGSFEIPRYNPAAVTLQNGKVLLIGGHTPGDVYNYSTQIYDPVMGTWAAASDMFSPIADPLTVLLQDGTVFATYNRTHPQTYDPSTNQWTPTEYMINDHAFGTATLLSNGHVFLAGGVNHPNTEIYNPSTRTYSYTGFMTTIRVEHGAALLPNGKVLLAGGRDLSNPISSAEIFDPVTQSFTPTGSMNRVRQYPGIAALPDGRILVAGGLGASGSPTTAEIYDLNTGIWTLTGSLNTARYFPGGLKLVPLADGTIIAVGSHSSGTSETYDPTTGSWTMQGNLQEPQCFGALTSLLDGKVLFAGGYDCVSPENRLSIAQLYSAVGQLTELSPAKIWVGLKNSDYVGTRFDLKAEVYKNSTELVSSGQLDNVWGGSSGFNNANLQTIEFNPFSPVDFPQGSTLSIKLYVRNACQGPTHNSGTARLWYDDAAANSRLDATIEGANSYYYLRNNFILSTTVGSGPKKKIDVNSGSPCSPYKTFGTWSITP